MPHQNQYESHQKITTFLQTIIDEDIHQAGDVTTLATVPEKLTGTAQIVAKQVGIVAGNWVAEMVFNTIEPELEYVYCGKDGTKVSVGMVIAKIKGPVRGILTAERTALNLFGRLSGIATFTNKFVEKIQGTNVKILDTRKTTPGLRFLEKYAVTVGGGHNHRFGLWDMVLIKENHIKAAGNIETAVSKCIEYIKTNNLNLKIEVETTNLAEVKTALALPIDRIMLDNMSVEMIKEAVAIIKGAKEIEISGGVNLQNVRSYALPGVDFISIGGLTHSVPALDISLLLE